MSELWYRDKHNLVILIPFFILSFVARAFAVDLLFYGAEIELKGKLADFKLILTFKETQNFTFLIFGKVFDLKANHSSCEVKVDEASLIECSPTQNTVYLDFKVDGLVKSLKDKEIFEVNLAQNLTANSFFVLLKLPEGMVLAEKPEGAKLLSDGRRIILAWEGSNLAKPFTLRIIYENVKVEQAQGWVWLMLALIPLAIYYIHRKFKAKKVVLSLLNEDESKVLKVLMEKGEIIQKDLLKLLGFSKSKLSKLLKKLENRGVLKLERIGRKNKIKLIKKL